MTKRILIIDGYNFIHRARSGFMKGEYSVVFNFFRNLRALVEQQDPSQIYFVIEGHPRARYQMMKEYKANRVINQIDHPEKHQAMVDFHRQKCIIIGLLKSYFPISVVLHPHHECDDAIFNLIDQGSLDDKWTVVSNDTDFIQLLQMFNNVELYNPMKKKYVKPPAYDYITWKSLRGDKSDNIPGIPGIGDKKAEILTLNLDDLSKKFQSNPEMFQIFKRNLSLIRFIKWNDEESHNVKIWKQNTKLWSSVLIGFRSMGFQSLLKEKTWEKFTNTFDNFFE